MSRREQRRRAVVAREVRVRAPIEHGLREVEVAVDDRDERIDNVIYNVAGRGPVDVHAGVEEHQRGARSGSRSRAGVVERGEAALFADLLGRRHSRAAPEAVHRAAPAAEAAGLPSGFSCHRHARASPVLASGTTGAAGPAEPRPRRPLLAARRRIAPAMPGRRRCPRRVRASMVADAAEPRRLARRVVVGREPLHVVHDVGGRGDVRAPGDEQAHGLDAPSREAAKAPPADLVITRSISAPWSSSAPMASGLPASAPPGGSARPPVSA
ncbi:MAG: hypothetical protein R2752_14155 [Vicinamibacterales bacterium]